MAWLTIDAGTSVIKSVVFAADGREISVARRRTTLLHPHPGWSEQNMDEVWQAVAATVREVAAACDEPILGIVSTAQGDGCWLVDAAGKPTGNAILWNDGRAAFLVERWQQQGLVGASFQRSGSVTYSGLPNAILSWLHQHQPERVDGSRWSLTCNGWLIYKMTGRFVADLSDSANPFGDLLARGYSSATVASYGLADDQHRLPGVHSGKDVVWELSGSASQDLGLPVGLPVVMAPYDIVTTAYGSGAARERQACAILGTTICAEIIRSSVDSEAEPMGTTLPLDGGLFLRAMPTLTGCEALQWTAEALGLDGIGALDELAAGAARSGEPLYFLPYLSLAGERSPFLAPEATGSFHGLTLATTRSDIARAAFEGLSYVVRECFEAAARDVLLTEVSVCGGGARSEIWCQMIADVLGIPVVRPADTENGARGAYIFALFATGEVASIGEGVDRHVSVANTFTPIETSRYEYEGRYQRFRHIRDMTRQQWAVMGSR